MDGDERKIESRDQNIQHLEIQESTVSVKRKSTIILAGAVLGVLIAVAVLWPAPKEPEYQGKRLSKWLEQYSANSDSEKMLEAQGAIRAIGSNAVPVLIEWLKSEPPAWRRKLLGIAPGRRFLGGPTVTSLLKGSGELRVWTATMAFRFIGEEGSSAVPELTRLASDPGAPYTASAAWVSLTFVGPEGIVVLSRVITNQTLPGLFRAEAITYVGSGTNDDLLAVPAIRSALRDADANVRAAATNALMLLSWGGLKEK